jgi:hypothetical protein
MCKVLVQQSSPYLAPSLGQQESEVTIKISQDRIIEFRLLVEKGQI